MLFPAFAEMLSALSEADAELVVVGGYAVGVHLEPRATKDLDLFVRPTRANARRVLSALEQFGAALFDLTIDDLTRTGTVIQIGVPPQRIDLLTSISAVSFAEAWRSRVEVAVPGVARPVPFLGRQALLANKRAVGRPQDLADVALLEEKASRRSRQPRRPSKKRK